MSIENMSKAELKKFIKCYNLYVQDFEYSEGGEPVSIYEFLDNEYADYRTIVSVDFNDAKDDLFLVYSQNTSEGEKENEGFCTTLESARDIVNKKITDDRKFTIAKVELDSELINETQIEVYDFENGLEWKSGTSQANYEDLAKIYLTCTFYEIKNKPVNVKDVQMVLRSYFHYMEKEGIKPEINKNIDAKDFVEMDETVISHVLYHAELSNNPSLKCFFATINDTIFKNQNDNQEVLFSKQGKIKP